MSRSNASRGNKTKNKKQKQHTQKKKNEERSKSKRKGRGGERNALDILKLATGGRSFDKGAAAAAVAAAARGTEHFPYGLAAVCRSAVDDEGVVVGGDEGYVFGFGCRSCHVGFCEGSRGDWGIWKIWEDWVDGWVGWLDRDCLVVGILFF